MLNFYGKLGLYVVGLVLKHALKVLLLCEIDVIN